MDSVTESIVVQLQAESKKSVKQAKSSSRRPALEESSSEHEESEHPIIEFTAVSPQKPSKAQQRASQLTPKELEKKWEDDVSMILDEADDQANIVQDPAKQKKEDAKKAKEFNEAEEPDQEKEAKQDKDAK